MKFAVIVMLLLQLLGCATAPEVVLQDSYVAIAKQPLKKLTKWKFEGRMAISSAKDSWNANVKWQHKTGLDQIGLSGLLGQGATLIAIADDWVTIDAGKGPIEQSNDPDAFVSEQLGVFVPVQALASWVIGLPAKKTREVVNQEGFEQDGWLVSYKEWEKAGDRLMPHKIYVKNDQVKLKLIIEQWDALEE